MDEYDALPRWARDIVKERGYLTWQEYDKVWKDQNPKVIHLTDQNKDQEGR